MFRAVFTVFPVLSIAFVFNRLITVWHACSSRAWPTASGHIESSRPDRASGDPGDLAAYRVAIRYTYRLNGAVLTANRLFFGDGLWTLSAARADQLVAKYAQGTSVRVHYDPSHAARAVLEPGIQASTVVGLLVSLVVAGMTIWMFAASR